MRWVRPLIQRSLYVGLFSFSGFSCAVLSFQSLLTIVVLVARMPTGEAGSQ